jgi:hypothetical protein
MAELIQPSALLPFQINEGEAVERARQWLVRQRFCPGDLAQTSSVDRPHGVYLPFWTFDLGGTIGWRAKVREGYGSNGPWTSASGIHLVYADDLLVAASRSVPQEWADTLFNFDTKGLVPYSENFIAGYTVAIYQIPLEDASLIARQRALQNARSEEQQNSLGGKTYRDFTMNSAGMTVDSFKLVLLPLWLAGYRYRDQKFPLAVNGQSGAVAGQVPRSKVRQFLATLFGGSRRAASFLEKADK